MVGYLAVMPWLAFALLASCIIASVRPFRSRFRFMSALVALVPMVIYLILAWLGSTETVAGKIDPVDRIKFVAPWVLAIVAATIAFALVSVIAKVVDYRPGAITPLLALMFGLPVALFELHVGRDELHYRLLEALNREYFTDVDASPDLDRAIDGALRRQSPLHRSRRSVRESVEQRWLLGLATDLGQERSELTAHQSEIAERCDRFLKYFPESRYAGNALFIKARALDMRMDPDEFRRTKWIRFHDDFPSVASQEVWRLLAEISPDSILGTVALLRLAQLEARDGDVDRAIGYLERLLPRVDRYGRDLGTKTTMEGPLRSVLGRDRPEAGLNIPVDQVLLEAHRLHDLFTANRDPIYGYDPISGPRHRKDPLWFGLMDIVPRQKQYISNLQMLRAAYPNCQIGDNLELEIAKATASLSLKIERLENCLRRFPERDAVPEALFRLGVAYKESDLSARSEESFARLFADHPNSIWTREAGRYVSHLRPARLTRAGP